MHLCLRCLHPESISPRQKHRSCRVIMPISTDWQILSIQRCQHEATISDSMHAALISFGAHVRRCGGSARDNQITVSNPAASHGYAGCGCGCGGGCAKQHCRAAALSCLPAILCGLKRMVPLWQTDYHPAWYFYPEHRMLFHPADYTQPYPYRERENSRGTIRGVPARDRCPCLTNALDSRKMQQTRIARCLSSRDFLAGYAKKIFACCLLDKSLLRNTIARLRRSFVFGSHVRVSGYSFVARRAVRANPAAATE